MVKSERASGGSSKVDDRMVEEEEYKGRGRQLTKLGVIKQFRD